VAKETQEPALNPAPQKFLHGTITDRKDITSDLWTIHVRPEAKLQFLPGQYVAMGLPQGARIIERPYSIVSSPEEPELEFFLELVPGGELTSRLYLAGTGDEVLLRRSAKGRFFFDTAGLDHFMAATVTGVAPFVSMLRHFAGQPAACLPARSVVLLHAASYSSELAYAGELEAFARRFPWFHYIPTVSRAWLDPGWGGERGRVEDVFRKHLDAFGLIPGSTTLYVAGNPQMIEMVKGIAQRTAFPREAIKEEIYWPLPGGINP
jgi:ferredoxin--NADP+ reductase